MMGAGATEREARMSCWADGLEQLLTPGAEFTMWCGRLIGSGSIANEIVRNALSPGSECVADTAI